MADISLVIANKINAATIPFIQHTFVAAEAIVAGAPVSLLAASGKVANADANDTGSTRLRCWGIALRSVAAGEAVTVVRVGFIEGYDLSALGFDDPVYVSNTVGRLGTTAGGASVIVGRVLPVNGQLLGAAPDKILFVNCTDTD